MTSCLKFLVFYHWDFPVGSDSKSICSAKLGWIPESEDLEKRMAASSNPARKFHGERLQSSYDYHDNHNLPLVYKS